MLAVPVLVTAWGLPYYALPLASRLRHPLHPLLKPSGPVGLAFGVLAVTLFLFMWAYPFRKKARWLAWTGTVARWLDVHIVMGLSLPFIAAVHSAWRFEGLIGLGMSSMVICATRPPCSGDTATTTDPSGDSSVITVQCLASGYAWVGATSEVGECHGGR